MSTSYLLTGNIHDSVGDDAKALRVYVTHNAADADGNRMPLVDLDNNKVLLPVWHRVAVAADGTISQSLLASDSTGLNVPAGTLRWTLMATYVSPGQSRTEQTTTIRNFAITGALDLSDAVGTADPPATVANEYLTQMQTLVDQAELITGLTGEEDAVDYLLKTPGTKPNTTLTAEIAGQATPIASGLDDTHELRQGARPLPVKRMFGGYLAKWDSALAQMRAGVRDAKILCIGDSTTAGVGGGTEASYVGAGSYVDKLVALLNERFFPAANGLQIPRATSAGTPTDTRWTLGTGWSKGDAGNATTAYVGFGGRGCNYFAAFDATGTLTFNDPRILADTFDIYYLTTTGAGATFTAQATGGAASASTPTGGLAAKGIAKITVSAGVAATTNAVTITPGGAAGSVYIVGIEPYLAGSRRIRVGNAGASGSYAFSWAGYSDGSSSNTWNSLYAIQAYAPDLTIIDLGINDADPARNTVATTFDTYIGQIIDAAKVSGDVILKTFIPVAGREAMMDQYAAKLRARNLALVDVYAAWGTADQADAAGFVNADNIHGSADGYAVEAGIVYMAVTQRADGTKSGAPLQWNINGPAGSDRSLVFQTSGVNRWVLRANNTAESGANAGSDLALVPRDDAGAALPAVFTIVRSSGRIVLSDGINLGFGTGTGTRIGATSAHKMAFWGATPSAQPAAVADATDAATVITQLNTLLARLRATGLIAP